MQKINFQNLPSTTTPINATNLNAIQTNAETAINDVAAQFVAEEISTNDFLTLASGVQLLYCNVYKMGTLIFGQITLQASTSFGGGTNVFSIKSPYKVKNYFYKICGLANVDWAILSSGYVFMSGQDCVVADQNSTGYKYASFDFVYEANINA